MCRRDDTAKRAKYDRYQRTVTEHAAGVSSTMPVRPRSFAPRNDAHAGEREAVCPIQEGAGFVDRALLAPAVDSQPDTVRKPVGDRSAWASVNRVGASESVVAHYPPPSRTASSSSSRTTSWTTCGDPARSAVATRCQARKHRVTGVRWVNVAESPSGPNARAIWTMARWLGSVSINAEVVE
jgi:hypothetical protein